MTTGEKKARHSVNERASDPKKTESEHQTQGSNELSAQVAIVIGASGGIANQVVKRFQQDKTLTHVVAISRSRQAVEKGLSQSENFANSVNQIEIIESDYSEKSIEAVVQKLERFSGRIKYLVICNGILHGDKFGPERKIEELSEQTFLRVVRANTLVPILWLRSLKKLLKRKDKTSVAVFSARIGSISDNRLGGWYSYRSSKAALNMLLKTLSIELQRSIKNVQLYAFHPGTTDTALSKPFQSNVPDDKLFKPQFVASQLIKLLENDSPVKAIEYIDWDHQGIEW